MKQTYLKILIAATFFQSNILWAEVNVNNSNQQANQNLQYKTCVDANPTTDENGQTIHSNEYNQCLAYNRYISGARAYGGNSEQLAKLALTMKEKPQPKCDQYSNTVSSDEGGGYNAYQYCMQQFNNSPEKKAWDIKQSVAAQEADSAKNKTEGQLADKSATGSMAEIQKKNEDGQQIYQIAGIALAGYAAYQFATASACAGPTWGGCVPPLVAAGAAFLLLSAKSNQQASEHGQSAFEACNTYNQLSSAQKDCSGIPTVVTTPPITTVYNPDGTCAATAPAGCKPIASTTTNGSGKIPTNCKDAKGQAISCIAAGSEYYKQNPNGSVTVKTGKGKEKTFTSADFADKKSMMAAGMSAADADKLMNDLYGKNGALAKAGLDAKNLAASLGKDGDKKYGDFSSSGSANTVAIDANKDTHKKFGDKLGEAVADRRPSSEGLSRDYKGDLIGAAGDDIFSMMKRRYNLKNEQDSFIAP
jgi:hypothetical protein